MIEFRRISSLCLHVSVHLQSRSKQWILEQCCCGLCSLKIDLRNTSINVPPYVFVLWTKFASFISDPRSSLRRSHTTVVLPLSFAHRLACSTNAFRFVCLLGCRKALSMCHSLPISSPQIFFTAATSTCGLTCRTMASKKIVSVTPGGITLMGPLVDLSWNSLVFCTMHTVLEPRFSTIVTSPLKLITVG